MQSQQADRNQLTVPSGGWQPWSVKAPAVELPDKSQHNTSTINRYSSQ